MPADAAVRGGDDVAGSIAPSGDHAIDRGGRQVGAVGEDHSGCPRLRGKRSQPAAQGGTGPDGPVLAAHDSLGRLQLIRPCDDDDLADRRAQTDAADDLVEQQRLLGPAEPRGRTGGEDDGRNGMPVSDCGQARILRRGVGGAPCR
jgi:hypothetical protein